MLQELLPTWDVNRAAIANSLSLTLGRGRSSAGFVLFLAPRSCRKSLALMQRLEASAHDCLAEPTTGQLGNLASARTHRELETPVIHQDSLSKSTG